MKDAKILQALVDIAFGAGQQAEIMNEMLQGAEIALDAGIDALKVTDFEAECAKARERMATKELTYLQDLMRKCFRGTDAETESAMKIVNDMLDLMDFAAQTKKETAERNEAVAKANAADIARNNKR